MDTSAARVKVLLTAKPDVIEDKERTIQALEREKRALERDQLHKIDIDKERYQEINDALEKFNAEVVELKERWLKEQELANKEAAFGSEKQALQVGLIKRSANE